jgi:hypothetical protein
MALLDWGDLAMHGAPFLWLAWALVAELRLLIAPPAKP